MTDLTHQHDDVVRGRLTNLRLALGITLAEQYVVDGVGPYAEARLATNWARVHIDEMETLAAKIDQLAARCVAAEEERTHLATSLDTVVATFGVTADELRLLGVTR
jgi:hypothetical protein